MKKKKWIGIILVGMAALVWSLGCEDNTSSPGSTGQQNTGSNIQVTTFTRTSGPDYDVIEGSTVNMTDMIIDITFSNLAPYPGGEAMTDVTIESFMVEYTSTDPGSVPLRPLSYDALNLYVGAGGTSKITGLTLIAGRSALEFITKGGNPNLYPVYECAMTFYGHNQFGYPVRVDYSIYAIFGDF